MKYSHASRSILSPKHKSQLGLTTLVAPYPLGMSQSPSCAQTPKKREHNPLSERAIPRLIHVALSGARLPRSVPGPVRGLNTPTYVPANWSHSPIQRKRPNPAKTPTLREGIWSLRPQPIPRPTLRLEPRSPIKPHSQSHKYSHTFPAKYARNTPDPRYVRNTYETHFIRNIRTKPVSYGIYT